LRVDFYYFHNDWPQVQWMTFYPFSRFQSVETRLFIYHTDTLLFIKYRSVVRLVGRLRHIHGARCLLDFSVWQTCSALFFPSGNCLEFDTCFHFKVSEKFQRNTLFKCPYPLLIYSSLGLFAGVLDKQLYEYYSTVMEMCLYSKVNNIVRLLLVLNVIVYWAT